MTLVDRGETGPWIDADRRHFEAHPEVRWIVRLPMVGELAAMRAGYLAEISGQRKLLQAMVTDEPAAEACIFVVRIQNGRVRFPVLRINGGLFVPGSDGMLVPLDPDELADHLAREPTPVDLRPSDACERCERRFCTGEVVPMVGTLSLCLPCMLADGGKPTAISQHITAEDGAPESWPASTVARVRRGAAYCERVTRFGFDPKAARAFLRGEVARG